MLMAFCIKKGVVLPAAFLLSLPCFPKRSREQTDRKILIQHLLVINDSTVIKHWREDWELNRLICENTQAIKNG